MLNSEITEAWDNCLAAAQRYGSYVSALNNIDADIEAAGGSSGSGNSNNTIVGTSGNHSSSTNEDRVHAIIKEMYANMNEHGGSGSSTSTDRKRELSERNLDLGAQLAQYGISAYRSPDKEDLGTWYTDTSKRELLFEKYKKCIYHKGGIAGNSSTLKQNEIMAVLEKGETILDKKKQDALYNLVNFSTTLSDKFSKAIASMNLSYTYDGMRTADNSAADTIINAQGQQPATIQFGDVYIYGSSDETVEQHREINRQFTNEILKTLNIKR